MRDDPPEYDPEDDDDDELPEYESDDFVLLDPDDFGVPEYEPELPDDEPLDDELLDELRTEVLSDELRDGRDTLLDELELPEEDDPELDDVFSDELREGRETSEAVTDELVLAGRDEVDDVCGFDSGAEEPKSKVSLSVDDDPLKPASSFGWFAGAVTFVTSTLPAGCEVLRSGVNDVRTPSVLSVTISTPLGFTETGVPDVGTAEFGAASILPARDGPPGLVTLPERSSPPIRPRLRVSRLTSSFEP